MAIGRRGSILLTEGHRTEKERGVAPSHKTSRKCLFEKRKEEKGRWSADRGPECAGQRTPYGGGRKKTNLFPIPPVGGEMPFSDFEGGGFSGEEEGRHWFGKSTYATAKKRERGGLPSIYRVKSREGGKLASRNLPEKDFVRRETNALQWKKGGRERARSAWGEVEGDESRTTLLMQTDAKGGLLLARHGGKKRYSDQALKGSTARDR